MFIVKKSVPRNTQEVLAIFSKTVLQVFLALKYHFGPSFLGLFWIPLLIPLLIPLWIPVEGKVGPKVVGPKVGPKVDNKVGSK